jgi:hypothetical protein
MAVQYTDSTSGCAFAIDHVDRMPLRISLVTPEGRVDEEQRRGGRSIDRHERGKSDTWTRYQAKFF